MLGIIGERLRKNFEKNKNNGLNFSVEKFREKNLANLMKTFLL